MIKPSINYLKFRRYIIKQLLSITETVCNPIDAEIHLRMYLYCFHNTDEDKQWMHIECNTLRAMLGNTVCDHIEFLKLTEKLIEEREIENGK